MIKLAISSCLQVLITITIFNTRVKLRNSQFKLFRWISFSLSNVVLCLLLFLSTSKFCSSRSVIFSTSEVFKFFKVFNASKLQNSWSNPFRNRSTSFSVGLPRMVCAFVCETSVWGIVISGDFFTKHGGILYKLSCLRGMALRLSRFSFWCENYTCGDQIRRRTACIFWPELSYESSSYNVNLSRCN